MRKYSLLTIGLILLILSWSCKEIYFPDEISSPERIPVIQGLIQEDAVPAVRLSWALAYYDQLPEYITGATVSVTDDLGHSASLEDGGEGYYSSASGEFRGQAGRTYTLHVLLPDGNEYVSSPALLHSKPAIDSLYADPGKKQVYTYNEYDVPVSDEQEGLFILSDLSDNSDSVLYYRFNTKVVKEMTYIQDPGTLNAKPVFKWEVSALDNVYSVNHTVQYENHQVLRDYPVGFLQFLYDRSLATVKASAPYTIGWVLIFKVYAITADAYDYYNSIALQLGSNDQMFAPVPSQIKSTIHCVTDPDRAAIGVFEASSCSTIYKAFAWENLENYEWKNVQSFPEYLENGLTLNLPPDFWVPFY